MTDQSSPCPEHVLALGALADGELDALSAAALEQHLRGCVGCRAALTRIEDLRTAMDQADLRDPAPTQLRRQIEASIMSADSPRSHASLQRRSLPWIGGGAIGALAASLAFTLALPRIAQPELADALVDSQIRSLQSGHLVDVETSDRHTVKPWFNGRIAFAPKVVDLKDRGFPLVGGRLDVLDGEAVAVLVYKRRLHTINLFIRPYAGRDTAPSSQTHVAGYSLVHWTAGGLEYWAVSDLDGVELRDFGTAFVAS